MSETNHMQAALDAVFNSDKAPTGPPTGAELKRVTSEMIAMGQTLDPEIARIAKRIYEPIPGCPTGVKDLLSVLSSNIVALAAGVRPGLSKEECLAEQPEEFKPHLCVFMQARRYKFPFYAVSQSLTQALTHTRMPDVWRKDQITLGTLGVYFLIPHGLLRGDCDEDVTVLGIAVAPVRSMKTGKAADMFIVTGHAPAAGSSWFSTLPFEDDGTIDLAHHCPFTVGTGVFECVGEVNEEASRAAIRRMQHLGVQLACIMSERPHLALPGARLKTVKKTQREVWVAPTLGRSYRIARLRKDGSAAPDEPVERSRAHEHLVLGHHKIQRYGKGRALTKTIMIDPYFRCLE